MTALSRRALLQGTAGLLLAPAGTQALAPRSLQFPRDFGAHPDLRTEWWYITGHARAGQRVLGFQVTFFRARVDAAQSLRSAFAARQLIFAHAAITDLQGKRLWHDQRIARAGFGMAQADEADTRIALRDWTLTREGPGAQGHYTARIAAQDFSIELRFDSTQPLLLQGREGLSRKGPLPKQASYYYSRPWLDTAGRVNGRPVRGNAWFDHEWSSELLDPEAQGWDWAGLHLDDGRALMVFRIRDRQGGTLWTQSRWIEADELRTGRRIEGPAADDRRPADAPSFSPIRHWQSPRTDVHWPVEMAIQLGELRLLLDPLLDDQELDTRAATGVLYWEGAVRIRDAGGRSIGRGYLELTGYGEALRI